MTGVGSSGSRWFHGGRFAVLGLSLVAAAVALAAEPLRSGDPTFGPLARPLLAASLGLVLVAATMLGKWRRAGVLGAVALVGQTCALELIEAPPFGVYQHYLAWTEIFTSPRGLFLVGILVQTVAVALMGRSLWSSLWNGAVGLFGWGRLGVLAVVLGFAAVVPSGDALRTAGELVLSLWVGAVALANLLLIAAAVPVRDAPALVDDATRPSGWSDRLPWIAAGWVTILSAAISRLAFEGVPHIPDAVSYLFQAKYLALGRLYLPAPPDADAFALGQVVNDGVKWYGYGFPGWPAVLAIGVRLGVPWLVNPVLGGIAVLLGHRVLARAYGSRIAGASACLVAASPWFLFMSASFLTHPVTLVWSLGAVLAIQKAREGSPAGWGLVAGCLLGALALTRPLEAVLVGGVLGLWTLGVGGARLPIRGIVSTVAGAVAVGGLIFPYSATLTGDPTYPPFQKSTDEMWYPGADRLGFGPDIGNVGWPHLDPLPGHGPLDAILNTNKNAFAIGFELFGWGFSSLLVALAGLLVARPEHRDWLWIGLVVAIVLGHVFYWFPGGPEFVSRYWYQALVPLALLTVLGVIRISERLRQAGHAAAARRVAPFVIAASVIGFVNVVPWRLAGKYRELRGFSAGVGRLASGPEFENALVLIQEDEPEDYASAFMLNPLTLETPGTIFARDLGPGRRDEVRRHFPDRPMWIFGRSDAPRRPWRIVEGPFAPGEMP